MYLHLGNGRSVRISDIVGIFDAESATVSQTTKKFLSDSQKNGAIESVSYDIPRSFVVTRDKTYISHISASALSGRCKKPDAAQN